MYLQYQGKLLKTDPKFFKSKYSLKGLIYGCNYHRLRVNALGILICL
jgi:hypothetical protein